MDCFISMICCWLVFFFFFFTYTSFGTISDSYELLNLSASRLVALLLVWIRISCSGSLSSLLYVFSLIGCFILMLDNFSTSETLDFPLWFFFTIFYSTIELYSSSSTFFLIPGLNWDFERLYGLLISLLLIRESLSLLEFDIDCPNTNENDELLLNGLLASGSLMFWLLSSGLFYLIWSFSSSLSTLNIGRWGSC